MSAQPVYKFLANLGDANPIDFGGYFVYEDTTGVYAPRATYLEAVENERGTEVVKWIEYRFDLDRCTYVNGILSDNKFHPSKPAWWAKTEEQRKERPQDSTYLKNIADFVGKSVEELVEEFCSLDPIERAHAYRDVAEYHGWENFDSYPLTWTNRKEVEKRFTEECKRK